VTARTLALWESVEEILDRPVPARSPEQLALCPDPTAGDTLFDVDAPNWHHEEPTTTEPTIDEPYTPEELAGMELVHAIRIANTDGDLPQYRAECACGFRGLWLFVHESAVREGDRHLAAPRKPCQGCGAELEDIDPDLCIHCDLTQYDD
jgi:hypothetical protein